MRRLGTMVALGLMLGLTSVPAQAVFPQHGFKSMRQCDNLLNKWRHHIARGQVEHFPQLLLYFEAAYCAEMSDGSYNVIWPDRDDYGF